MIRTHAALLWSASGFEQEVLGYGKWNFLPNTPRRIIAAKGQGLRLFTRRRTVERPSMCSAHAVGGEHCTWCAVLKCCCRALLQSFWCVLYVAVLSVLFPVLVCPSGGQCLWLGPPSLPSTVHTAVTTQHSTVHIPYHRDHQHPAQRGRVCL